MAGAEWLMQQADLLTRLALEPGPANQALRLRSAGAGRSRSAIPSSLRPPERDVRCRIPCLNVARVIRARGEISPGKDALLPRTTAGSTSFRAKSGSVPYFFYSYFFTFLFYSGRARKKREPKLPSLLSNLS